MVAGKIWFVEPLDPHKKLKGHLSDSTVRSENIVTEAVCTWTRRLNAEYSLVWVRSFPDRQASPSTASTCLRALAVES